MKYLYCKHNADCWEDTRSKLIKLTYITPQSMTPRIPSSSENVPRSPIIIIQLCIQLVYKMPKRSTHEALLTFDRHSVYFYFKGSFFWSLEMQDINTPHSVPLSAMCLDINLFAYAFSFANENLTTFIAITITNAVSHDDAKHGNTFTFTKHGNTFTFYHREFILYYINSNHYYTRMHSSRMRTARLSIVLWSVVTRSMVHSSFPPPPPPPLLELKWHTPVKI